MIHKELETTGKKYVSLGPTNLSALIINGLTLHKFASKLKKKKALRDMKLDYIFVDEVSMMSEMFYKFLLMLKRAKPTLKFIITGDFNQLPVVNDRIKDIDYENSVAFYELCDKQKVILTKCRRSDQPVLFDEVPDIKPKQFENEYTDYHMSFTNKTRIKVNDEMMKKRKAVKRPKTGKFINLAKMPGDDNSQEVILTTGTPIIAKMNDKKMGIVNNQRFIITKIDNDVISIKNDNEVFTIEASKVFQRFFRVAFCTTIHCSQGLSIDHPYTIHEWNKLDQKLKYVALSRATKKDYINIIV